jgi:simple sugar transport system permease protein
MDANVAGAVPFLTAKRIGIAGLVCAALAAFVATPPLTLRAAVVPIILGVAAIALGGWAMVGGEGRIGFGAILGGITCAALGYFETQASASNLHTVVVWGPMIAAMLRYATPLTYAAIGGMFSERSGVVNIGLEGMMLMGCFFGVWGADKSGSWVVGIIAAAIAGGLLAFLYAVFAIHLRVDQIVGGTAIYFLAYGITGYLFIQIYGEQGTPGTIPQIPDVRIHLDGIPPARFGQFLDDAFGQLNLMIWLSFVVIILSYVVMFRTPLGLRIRSVGEHPRAADTVGISVYKVRYGSVTLSGALAALGGAYLTLGFVHSFNEQMTHGRGFIALAALIFGKWNPFGAFGACLLFGLSSAIADRLALTWGTSWQTLFQALPYLLTLIAVAGVVGRSIPPAAVGRPYKKQ